MVYIILCSSDNVLSVKGGGNAWTILKLLEKFYDEEGNELGALGVFADAVIYDAKSLKSIDECMNNKTEAYLGKGELPFKKGLGIVLSKKIIGPNNLIYKFLAPAYYLFLSLKRNFSAKNNLVRLIDELSVNASDVVILDCHDPFSAYFMNKVKIPCRKVSVAHSHEIGSQALNLVRVRKGFNPLVKKINLFIEKYGYKNSEFISFPSKGAMDTLLEDRPDLASILKNKKVEILYTGITTKLKKNLVAGSDMKNRNIRLLFVGRLIEEKGFDLVLEAVKLLKNSGYDISLDVVGFGDLDPVRKFVSDNGLGEAVFLRGVLSHDEVLKLMISSDILVAPHRKSVFDLVMLEAMHVGLPIVSTSVGGNLELIRSEKEGVLVKMNDLSGLVDGIKLMIEDDALRIGIADNARRYALDFFSEEAMFKRYGGFFDKISKK